MTDTQKDIWCQWLLQRRFGGDEARAKAFIEFLYPVRDTVLSHVDLSEGDTLLDVGCGDGLISFGALDKFDQSQVIFSDISDDLLKHAEALAQDMQVRDRCQFVHASADDLSAFKDDSVDAVTTRSVLIYVAAKQKAFQEFHRVLKPGGQLSIFEPINRFGFPEPPGRFGGYDVTPVIELAQRLTTLFDRIQPETDPIADFDERDLIAFAENAGFSEIHLELQVKITAHEKEDWSGFSNTAWNPKVPTLEEAMQEAFSPEEKEWFVNHLRPLVEAGQGMLKRAIAYLWAVK